MNLDYVWLIPGIPLLGTVVNGLFGKRLPRALVGAIACAAVAVSFAVSCLVYLSMVRLPPVERSHMTTLFVWISSGSFRDISPR